MLRSDLCDFSDAYVVVKGTITLTRKMEEVLLTQQTGCYHLKTMHHLSIAYQRSTMY